MRTHATAVSLCSARAHGADGLASAVAGARFIFSSKRRHTSLTCDWSSDVCSSDLPALDGALPVGSKALRLILPLLPQGDVGEPGRSEERRVGKECRSRWSPYH